MKTGSYFEIGSTHTVCEDYAIHTDNAVIVSDGCSNGGGPSMDTDWGSRILCHLGLEHLPILLGSENNEFAYIQRVINHAVVSCNSMNKIPSCLTASMVMAYKKDNAINTLRVGDGIVGAKFKDGRIEFSALAFNMNAPFYPIYALSPQGLDKFFGKFGKRLTTQTFVVKENTDEGWANIEKIESELDYSENPYQTLNYKIEDVEFVFVGSDGWESFMKPVNSETSKFNEPVSLPEIVRELIDFGNFNKNFVYHQCHWMLKLNKPGTFVRRGWEHADDFSMGAIYCG